MDRLDRANMMVLSALMHAAVTIGELRIRGHEAARPRRGRTESKAHRNSVLLVARGETYRQPHILECPIFLLIPALVVLGGECRGDREGARTRPWRWPEDHRTTAL